MASTYSTPTILRKTARPVFQDPARAAQKSILGAFDWKYASISMRIGVVIDPNKARPRKGGIRPTLL